MIAPLYWPTQARSDCSARRSPCAIALAVSAGVCNAGRAGVVAPGGTGLVATGLDLAPAAVGAGICAVADCWADAAKATDTKATNINVALSIDLMTHPGPLKRAQ